MLSSGPCPRLFSLSYQGPIRGRPLYYSWFQVPGVFVIIIFELFLYLMDTTWITCYYLLYLYCVFCFSDIVVICIRRGGVISVTSHPLWQPSSVKMWCKCVQNSPECIKINVNFQNFLNSMTPKALKITLLLQPLHFCTIDIWCG